MKDLRDKTVLTVGNRIAQLRKERGLTQADFCKEYSDFCGFSSTLLVPAVSSWEQNRRLPTVTNLVNVALFYGVSCDYLFGITDERNTIGSIEKQGAITKIRDYSDVPIPANDLMLFHGKPVFVKFKNNVHLNQWGILNYNSKKIACKDFVISLSVNIECYPSVYEPPVRTRINSYQMLLNSEYVWVEMQSQDNEVSATYNGRYTHSPDKRFLIKMDTNIPLSYNGLDVAYVAFKG